VRRKGGKAERRKGVKALRDCRTAGLQDCKTLSLHALNMGTGVFGKDEKLL